MKQVMHTPGRPNGYRRVRVIPTLLLDGRGRLVKTVRFGKRTYIGDPVNAVRILNTKEVDELILLDIDASAEQRAPPYSLIADIASEAFMPVAYGGGLFAEDQVAQIIDSGVEKVIISSALARGTDLIEATARRWGSQAATVCLPIARNWWGRETVRHMRGKKSLVDTVTTCVKRVTDAGAGEILVYSIDRDGTWDGYDSDLLARVAATTSVPVVACGGAGNIANFRDAVCNAGCAAVAAGSMFIYQAKGRGVLISYPSQERLQAELFSQLPS
jgi:cyclase